LMLSKLRTFIILMALQHFHWGKDNDFQLI
jgi:hypothetical protein